MSNQTEPSITERLKHLRYPATYGHIKLVNASKWAADEIDRLTHELEHARAEARAMHSAYETSVRLRVALAKATEATHIDWESRVP